METPRGGKKKFSCSDRNAGRNPVQGKKGGEATLVAQERQPCPQGKNFALKGKKPPDQKGTLIGVRKPGPFIQEGFFYPGQKGGGGKIWAPWGA